MPQSLDEVLQLARLVVASGLAPRGFDTAEACVVGILHGLEVGLAPLAALQRIAVLHGRPTIWGDGALALVKASGLAVLIDERMEGDGSQDWCAVCRVQRRGDLDFIERRFSVADARRAGLWGLPGPWQHYPQRMLQMRARAFALRDAFPAVLGGLYLREEVESEIAPRLCEGEDRSPSPRTAAPHSTEESICGNSMARRVPEPVPNRVPYAPPPAPQLVPAVATSALDRPRAYVRQAPSPAEMATLARSANREPAVDPAPDAGAPNQPGVKDLRVDPPAPEPPSPSPTSHPATASSATGVPPTTSSLLRPLSRDARLAERLRREAGWSIPRPRTPARRRAASSVSAARNRARSALAGLPGPLDARDEETAAPLRPVPVHADVLALFDDALACACDEATIFEIEEEFAARLAAIAREQREVAQRILARHRDRVRAVALPADAEGGRRTHD